jgi:hypothetical protein
MNWIASAATFLLRHPTRFVVIPERPATWLARLYICVGDH